MSNVKDEIIDTVMGVINKYHDISNIDYNEPLTGERVSLDATELVYVVIELMEKFQITFDAADFENYHFNTINGIVESVLKHI